VDASPVEVEAERFRPAVAERQGGGGLSTVGEAMQFAQPEGAVAGLDVAEDATGTDRSELLIITDRPDTATAAAVNRTAVSREMVSAIPASSMITNVERPMRSAQSGRSLCSMDCARAGGRCMSLTESRCGQRTARRSPSSPNALPKVSGLIDYATTYRANQA
jgi:hypothetical protein